MLEEQATDAFSGDNAATAIAIDAFLTRWQQAGDRMKPPCDAWGLPAVFVVTYLHIMPTADERLR